MVALFVIGNLVLLIESYVRYRRWGRYGFAVSVCEHVCTAKFNPGDKDCSGFDSERLELPEPTDAYYGRPHCEVREGRPVAVTFGRDRKPGGTGDAHDVACWRLDTEAPECECDFDKTWLQH